MGFRKMISPQPSHDRKRAKKRSSKSSSPKRTRSSRSGRKYSGTDNYCRYPVENKIRKSSRHTSPQQSNRHRKHKKASPSRKKVNCCQNLK